MGSRASSEPLSSLLDMNMDELDRLVEEEDGERVGKGPWGMRGRGRSSDSVIVGDMDDLTDSEVIMAIGADGEQLFSGGGVGHSHPGGVHGRDSPSWLGLFNGKYPVIVDFDYDMSNDDDDDEDEPNPAVAWVKMQRQFDELEAQLGGVTEEWLNSRQDPDRIMAEKDPLTHVVIHPRAEHEAQQAVVDLWETHLEEQRQWSPEKRALMGVEAASEPGEEDAAVEASLELDADMEEWEVDALREKARTAYRVERARAAAAVTAQATAAAASPMGAMSASAVQAAGDDVSAALLVPPSVAGGDALMAGEAEVVDGVAAAGTGVTVAPMHAEEDETAALNRLLFTRTVKSDVMAMRSCFDASRDVRLKDSFDTRVYTEEEVRAFIGQVPISPKAFRIQRDSLRANYRLIRPYKGDFEEFLEQEGRFMDDERDTAAPSLLEGNDDMLSMDFTDFEKDVVSKALDIGDDEDDEVGGSALFMCHEDGTLPLGCHPSRGWHVAHALFCLPWGRHAALGLSSVTWVARGTCLVLWAVFCLRWGLHAALGLSSVTWVARGTCLVLWAVFCLPWGLHAALGLSSVTWVARGTWHMPCVVGRAAHAFHAGSSRLMPWHQDGALQDGLLCSSCIVWQRRVVPWWGVPLYACGFEWEKNRGVATVRFPPRGAHICARGSMSCGLPWSGVHFYQ
eukprot:jgi/Mesvir1/8364/Mv12618-RA.1